MWSHREIEDRGVFTCQLKIFPSPRQVNLVAGEDHLKKISARSRHRPELFIEMIIAMAFVKTVLICMCERCGYGRADHPETVGKPWVAAVGPKYCEGCGSPNWDVQMRSWARFARRAKSRVDRISSALGFPTTVPKPHHKAPQTGRDKFDAQSAFADRTDSSPSARPDVG